MWSQDFPNAKEEDGIQWTKLNNVFEDLQTGK